MKKQRIFFLMVSIMISMTLACAIGYEGLQISEDPEPVDPISEMFAQQTFEAVMAEESDQGSQAPAAAEIQATELPVASGSTDAETDIGGNNEYAITAQDFNCICSVDGNNQVIQLKIDGDQLEYAGFLYDKIAENTYKRSFMGYYILESGEGENKTSTQVDEERHTVIKITDEGFILENYQGDEGSPCCYYTFTKEK
ncbi:MAG TPA: hypothetical protein VK856_10925 [Anaerolineaceae bacterium]|nr:hypothetical protein [Anaerolineaceae bacterium]